MAEKAKPWYESKTLWANIITVIGGILLMVADQLTAGAPLTIAGIINIILRYLTTSPVKFK